MPEPQSALPAAVVEARIRSALTTINGSFDSSIEPVRRNIGNHVTRAAFPPLPVSAHVLDVRSAACNRLQMWAKVVIAGQDLHPKGLRAGDVPKLTYFLATHAAWLADLASGETVMEQMEASARDLAGISGGNATDEGTFLGACPLQNATDGSATPCGGQVRSTHGVGACSRCGMSDTDAWWEHHMFPEASRHVTARELVHEIHQQRGQRVNEATIRWWVNQGIIVSSGKDEHGRSLFDKGAVAKALAVRECA